MKKKEMLPLTNKENQSYHEQNTCYICKKEFKTDHNDKKTIKQEITIVILANIKVLLIMFVI